MDKFRKQPSEVLDYTVDCSPWLLEGDTVAGAVVTREVYSGDETTPTLVIDSTDLTATAVNAWLSGGTDRVDYKVTVRVTTTAGRVKETEFRIQCREV